MYITLLPLQVIIITVRSEEHLWGTSTSGGWPLHTSVRQQAVIVPFFISMLLSTSLHSDPSLNIGEELCWDIIKVQYVQ